MIVVNDPTYPLYPVLSCIGFVLCLIPLPWHIQAWNSGTVAFMFWTGIACFCGFINSVVWRDNLRNSSPVWCDISSKIIIGVSVGIPAATLCISRRLYYLTSGNTVSITRDDKRRMIIMDLAIALGIPTLIMILHYIVQGHRFDILEDIGCYPAVYNTLPAYFIYFMWPIVLGFLSACFSAMTLRSFWKRRLQFNQIVTSHNAMSMSRYMRLILLALVDVLCTLPLGIYSVYSGNKGVGLAPWISWEDTHYNFSRVGLVPTVYWYNNTDFHTAVELTRWLPVVCAFMFFALFGFATEAQKHYKLAFSGIMKLFGIKPKPSGLKSLKAGQGISLGHWKKQKAPTSTTDTTMSGFTPTKSKDSYNWTPPPPSATVSHFSNCSSATLAPSPTNAGYSFSGGQKKFKATEAQEEQDRKSTFSSTTHAEVYPDPAPSYYAHLPSQADLIGVPIRLDLDLDLEMNVDPGQSHDLSRKASTSSYLHSIEEGENSDVASVSTRSYYPAPPCSPPVPLSPNLASLPPPPRRLPRDVPLSISEPIEVPSDPSKPSLLPLTSLSLTPPRRARMLGVNNGAVFVTIQKQASVDGMV
ncbi:pheromone A receptor-domain-containing protein [Panaeolus papilionaceus]|nr:pheromone A receptor-domain-containing protein [Panaeolus papilionaceus]